MILKLNSLEEAQVLGTGAMSRGTLAKLKRGGKVQPIVLYRLKMALTTLGLEERAPELFKTAIGGAADPDPSRVIDDSDDDSESTAAAV